MTASARTTAPSEGQLFDLEPGTVIVVGDARITITAPVRVRGKAKEKQTREGGPVVTLECPEGCARGDDGRAYHVLMGRTKAAQWQRPRCGYCKGPLVPREEL